MAYHQTLQAIKELREEILYAVRQETIGGRVSGGGGGSSIVERRATRLADSVLLREMQRITTAIRETYAKVAKEECRQILYVRYGLVIAPWEPPSGLKAVVEAGPPTQIKDMIELLAMDESTFHRYRSGFIYGVAERLGWY